MSTALMLIAGLALLVVGAEALVRGASKIAAAVGISPLVIGLTVVAFGTSAPELAVGVQAALAGSGDRGDSRPLPRRPAQRRRSSPHVAVAARGRRAGNRRRSNAPHKQIDHRTVRHVPAQPASSDLDPYPLCLLSRSQILWPLDYGVV